MNAPRFSMRLPRYSTMLLFAAAMLGNAACIAEDLSTYSGKMLFGRLCASCHGTDATGNGPVAGFFKLAPPDLTRIAKRHGGAFPADKIHGIIDGRARVLPHGTREMPVWGIELAAADDQSPGVEASKVPTMIDRLVEYLRSIQSP